MKYVKENKPVIIACEKGIIHMEPTSFSIDADCYNGEQIFSLEGPGMWIPGAKTEQLPKLTLSHMTHKKIIFEDRTTIVLWKDGTKTVVRAAENEPFDPEKGVAVAFMKKALGNTSAHNKVLRNDVCEAMIRRDERIMHRAEKLEKKAAAKNAVERPFDAVMKAFGKALWSVKDMVEESKNATKSDS